MSEDSLQFIEPHVLRRTLSTGDIPSREVARPQRARMSTTTHRPSIEQAPMPAAVSGPAMMIPEQRPYTTWYGRTLGFFGFGRRASKARRELVSLIWNLSFGSIQVIFIIGLLTVSTHRESKTKPGVSEWHACDRPLGVWNCLWVVRIFLACVVSYWGWCRERQTRAMAADTESVGNAANSTTTSRSAIRPGVTSPVTPSRRQNSINSPQGTSDEPLPPVLPYSRLYARLSLLSSLTTVTWFLTAQILEYTSVNTCRLSSPHLWYLTLGILCIMYALIFEVFILGFVVFIIAPILLLSWNLVLLCLGRHPIQNPHRINPEISKLPKSFVDRIPLVVYIPSPPDEAAGSPKIPEAIYSYPPKPKTTSKPKRRFAFLRRSRNRNDDEKTVGVNNGQKGANAVPQTWEDHWEQGEYPFVRLEGNRAACAICLMDFEEPKRIAELPSDRPEGDKNPPSQALEGPAQNIRLEAVQEEDRIADMRLEDAGEGSQPLRLLSCGHVFHKTCLDPWLVDVSGRCPVCQRPVELPVKRKRGRRSQ